MNAIDLVELEYLDYSGSIEIAEYAGRVLREQLELAAFLFGVSVDELMTVWDVRPVWPFEVGGFE